MSNKLCPLCGGTGTQIVERFIARLGHTLSGAGPCDCEKGQAIKAARELRAAPPDPNAAPVVSAEAAAAAAEALSAVPFYPSSEAARTMIASEIRRLCRRKEDALWLVERMIRLYARWPGVLDMRLVYCSRFVPLDGFIPEQLSTEAYPDGIPAEFPAPDPPRLQLPPGQTISADPQLEAALVDLAHQKRLPAAGERFPGVVTPPRIAVTPAQKHFTPITQADIDREVEALHARKLEEEGRKEIGI